MTRRRPTRSENGYEPEPVLRRRPSTAPQLKRRADGSYQPEPPKRRYDHTGPRAGGDCAIQMRFAKGNPGRRKGSLNHITTVMKTAIIEGAAQSERANGGGLVAYLRSVADEFPKSYLRLLARLIPHDLRLRAELTAELETPEEIRAKLIERGVPIGKLDTLFERPQVPPKPPPPVSLQRCPDPPRTEPAPPLRLVNSSDEP
jgi:hypothetical protein